MMRSSTDWLRKYRSEGLDSGENAAQVKTEALDDKLAGKTVVKVEMLFTLLSEIRAAALNDTLAERETEEIETLG